MLRVLRERKASWILKILLLGVAVSFVSWGGYSYFREKPQTYAAQVNGTSIDLKDYNERYQMTIQQYREALGPQFSEKMVETLRLRENVLDSMISQVLITQEGKRLGFEVSDEELRDAIQSIPGFQVEGRFDPQMYDRWLRLKRMTPDDFEHMYRDQLLLNKVSNLVRQNGGKVSEEELKNVYVFENEKINLAFLKITPDAFRGQATVNDVEARDYYDKHKEELKTPAFVKVQYLLFRPSDYEGKAEIAPEEAKRYYESQKDRFKIPKQVKAREILIKAGQDEAAEKVELKRKKAEEILAKAKTAKDFAALAKQVSEAETASKGGDLGWLVKGRLDPEADQAVFAMKAGEVSAVIRRPAGFSIFKVEEVREERERPFEEAKDQIAQLLKREKAKSEAARKADEAFYSVFRNRDLEKYAQEKGVPIKSTDFFKEGDDIADFGRNPSIYSSVFSLKLGEVSSVISAPPNFFILKLSEKRESRIPSFEEAKEEVTRRVAVLKADEKAKQAAEEVLNQARSGKGIKEIGKEKGYASDDTGLFNRAAAAIPKIGPASEYGTILASLTEKNPVPKEALKTKDGYFVVKLAGSEPADMTKFEPAKKDLERRVSSQKQEEFYRGWLDQLKAKSKININKDFKLS
jgi:peptidyl-prolyl cis-trans isomerase D